MYWCCLQIGPSDGSTNWPQQVLTEFNQLTVDARRLIHVHNDTSIPVMMVDIYSDVATYEDHHSPSFSNLLVAKSLARETSTSRIVSWYNAVCGKLIESDAAASLRWFDIHQFQMPAICFATAAMAPRASYVVGNVMQVSAPAPVTSAVSGKKKQVEMLPNTTADRLQKEKMDRVDLWLKQEAQNQWKQAGVKMFVDATAAATGVSRPGNERPEVQSSRTEGSRHKVDKSEDCRSSKASEKKTHHTSVSPATVPNSAAGLSRLSNERPEAGVGHAEGNRHRAWDDGEDRNASDKKSGCTSVSPHMSFSAVQNPPPYKSKSEMFDAPERDVNGCDQKRPKRSGSSGGNYDVEEFMNQQLGGSGHKTRDHTSSVGEKKERPLFTCEQTTPSRELSGCSPAEKKADMSTVSDHTSAQHVHSNSFSDHSVEFCNTDIQQKTAAEASPLSPSTDADREQSKSEIPSVKVVDDEFVTDGNSWASWSATEKAICNEDIRSPPSLDVGSDNPASTSADTLTSPAIPPFSLTPTEDNILADLSVGEDEPCQSECSSSSLTVAKTHTMECVFLYSYLTANETSSIVSVTPPRKSVSTASAVSRVKLSSKVNSKAETLTNDDTIVAADLSKVSRCVPAVKLEIPESRRFTVLVSYVESPRRFWINVASEQAAQVRVGRLYSTDC